MLVRVEAASLMTRMIQKTDTDTAVLPAHGIFEDLHGRPEAMERAESYTFPICLFACSLYIQSYDKV